MAEKHGCSEPMAGCQAPEGKDDLVLDLMAGMHTAGSYENSRDMFKKTLCCCEHDIQTPSGILLHLMYHETISYTLDVLTALSDMIYETVSEDTELVLNCTEGALNTGVEFRASMFISFS